MTYLLGGAVLAASTCSTVSIGSRAHELLNHEPVAEHLACATQGGAVVLWVLVIGLWLLDRFVSVVHQVAMAENLTQAVFEGDNDSPRLAPAYPFGPRKSITRSGGSAT